MDTFFDKHGRDRIIHDWMKTHKPGFLPLYEYVLAKQVAYRNFNVMFLIAFEAGCAFARAAKTERHAKVDYDYEEQSN